MKNETLFQKIDQHRYNKKFRWNRPYYNFHKKTFRSRRLLNKIARTIKTKIDLHEALSQYVISDITAFEVYFKDIFLAIFKYRNDSKELLIKCHKGKLIEDKFDFEQLVKIEYEQYFLPEIVLQYRSFQNLKDINDVFTVITGKDFFTTISNYKNDPKSKTNFLHKDWNQQLKEYLDLRHNLIHNFNPDLRLKREDIEKLHWNMVLFVLVADLILDFEFITDNLKDEYKHIKEMKEKFGYVAL